MRLKVKSLFMIAAGLLFFAGPMVGSAFAQTANVGVSGGTPTNVTTCAPGNGGSAAYVPDGSGKYEIVYKFTDPAGSTSCTATIPILFSLYNTTGQYNFSTANASAATWTLTGGFMLDDTAYPDPSFNQGDNILLNATGLAAGEHTYTPTYSFSGCTGSCSPSTVTFINPAYGTLDGKVEIDVYVDGKDQLGITSLGTTGDSGELGCTDNGTTIIGGHNIPTLVQEGSASQWVYTYKISTGQTVCDAAPINLQIVNADLNDDTGTPDTYPIKIACDSQKSSQNFCTSAYADIPLSQPYTLHDGGDGTEYAYFDSGQLNTPGTYDFFFQVSDTNSGSDDLSTVFQDCSNITDCYAPEPSDGYVHVKIVVSSATQATQSFFTDGNFAGLLNCSGVAADSKDGVTFAIVPGGKGKHTIESTNPGEFFYNLIWQNSTNAEQTITFNVPTSDNVTSQGANSVHAYAFNSQGFDPSVSDFNTVLGYGTPCANPTSSTCTIQNVPAGDVVWIVWHVSYSQIGNSTSGLPKFSDVCSSPTATPTGTIGAKNNIYSIGQITYTGLANPITSSASAWGYLKH